MQDYLVKPVPDEDFYVVWSPVASGAAAHGSLEQLRTARPDMVTNELVAAADTRGTSAQEISGFADFAYGQEAFTFASHGGIDLVARKNLRAYLEAAERGEDSVAYVEHSMSDYAVGDDEDGQTS